MALAVRVSCMNNSYFQQVILTWASAHFPKAYNQRDERIARFFEEALELAQAWGMSKDEVLKFVDVVYSKPVGDDIVEMADAHLCLMALAEFSGNDLDQLSRERFLGSLAKTSDYWKGRQDKKLQNGTSRYGG